MSAVSFTCKKCKGSIRVKLTHKLEPFAYLDGTKYVDGLCETCADKIKEEKK